jgi:2-oxo-4-hydroxy-4-carboxy-5-ureidoimidazoline decarboxylase
VMRKTSIEEANAMSREEFVEKFGGLYEHSPWIAEGAEKERPFEDFEKMRRAFERMVDGASGKEKLDLIRAHPDLAGKAAVAGNSRRTRRGSKVRWASTGSRKRSSRGSRG